MILQRGCFDWYQPAWVPEARDGLLARPWLHECGEISIPERPGLGFEIDRRALGRYGKHFFTVTETRVALHALSGRGLTEAKRLGGVRRHRLGSRSREPDQTRSDPALKSLHALEHGYLEPAPAKRD